MDKTRSDLQGKNLKYILEYLRFKQSSKLCKDVLEDLEFHKTLKRTCSKEGFDRFLERLKLRYEVIKEAEKNNKARPTKAEVETRKGEVVINGRTRTEDLLENLGERKEIKVTIRSGDRVLVYGFDNDTFPYGVEGTVTNLHLPIDSYSTLRYEVEIPIYDQDGSLLIIEYTSCEKERLKLLERWDAENKIYHTSNLNQPVFTHTFGYADWNEFEEDSFGDKHSEGETSSADKPSA